MVFSPAETLGVYAAAITVVVPMLVENEGVELGTPRPGVRVDLMILSRLLVMRCNTARALGPI